MEPVCELVLDRYLLLEHLGSGGFGSVWLAHDQRLDREVAVKLIPRPRAGDRDGRRRAAREALAAARLSHPAIVALYEAGADEDHFYLVSEPVYGAALSDLYLEGALSDAELLRIGVLLCGALAHAHARGVVHRDVKPQNVIVPDDDDDAATPAKLTDFGVAQIAGEQSFTRSGDVIGTLAYMAPEQAEARPVTSSADLYSLALVLYEGLAGFNPVRGATPAETARRLGERLPPLARARRDLPSALCAALDRALAADARSRGSLSDLREALLSAQGELSVDRPAPANSRLRAAQPQLAPLGAPRRARIAGALAAGALVLAALLTPLGPHGAGSVGLLSVGAILAVAAAPRAGWLALAAGSVLWLAFAGEPGAALLLLLALAPTPILLTSSPWLWSAPALAPLLGAIGLAGAFPALAGRVSGAWRRGALGALAVLWAALAEPLYGRRLLLGPAHSSTPRPSWQGSLPDAISHALLPLLSGGALALAAVWALAAAAMPLLVRGREPLTRALAAILWATALTAATGALWGYFGASLGAVDSTVLVVGGALAAALAAPRLPTGVA
ncbi:MAG: protein kinase domain-containing protein [Solirubrobacteraceae bacterium]